MNQLYAEAGVKKKQDLLTITYRVLLVLAVFVALYIASLKGVFPIISVVMIAGVIFLFPRLNVDYEYVFVDGQIDFDRIIAKSKRKTLLRVDMEQMEIVAPSGSHALDGYTHVQLVTQDFSSGNREKKTYIIIANVKERKCRIVFEPSEKMIDMMKQKSPRKISLI